MQHFCTLVYYGHIISLLIDLINMPFHMYRSGLRHCTGTVFLQNMGKFILEDDKL